MRATLLLMLSGCGPEPAEPVPAEPTPASVSGRVCSRDGTTGPTDAIVYTNVFSEIGQLVEVRRSTVDAAHRWRLADLPPNRNYTIYVQAGPTLLDTHTVHVRDGEDVLLPDRGCFDSTTLRMLVVTGDFDDIEDVLASSFGIRGVDFVDGGDPAAMVTFFSDPDALAGYDLVLFNSGCAEKGIFWSDDPDDPTPALVRSHLDSYVTGGGAVIATDQAYDVIEQTWPAYLDFVGDDRQGDAAQVGEYDTVSAIVTNEALSAYIGDTKVEVDYALPGWPPIISAEPYVTVHLHGSVHYRHPDGTTRTLDSVPLMATFAAGSGRVTYATFPLSNNQSEDMTWILRYLLREISDFQR